MRITFLHKHCLALPAMVLCFIVQGHFLAAQISIQFIPALNGQSLNGLFAAQVQNAGNAVFNGKMQITVRDAGNKTVLTAVTPAMLMRPGVNLIQALAAQASIRFGNSAAAGIVAQTGRFPENDYEYCFEFTGTENKAGADVKTFENCFNYSLQPIVPLSLIYPQDGDELCNTRPAFTWQPGMPLVSNYRYKLVLAEQKNKQSAADALTSNIPIFQQEGIAGFTLAYPPQVQELQKDKKYVWQVTAYDINTSVTRSEIWLFSVNCNDQKTDSSKESYRQLSNSLNGNYYVTGSMLHFSFVHPYGTAELQYSITDITDPAKELTNLPPVKMQTGLNKIILPLEDIQGIQTKKMYLLKVKNIGDHVCYLQFLYK